MRQIKAEWESGGDRAVWKGVTAGVVSGLVGAWVMNQFQAALSKAAEAVQDRTGDGARQQRQESSGEDATIKTAKAVAEPALGRRLTEQEKKLAGPVVHYTFGSSVGAIYGALAEVAPRTTTAWGLPFGAAVWLGADEVAVPAFGLSKSPFEYPASTHASALAAHLVYGVTTDFVRRAIRAVM